jgi:mRNA-degrading endonuclease RelE of RelBE toxin-antitoxin system
VSSPNRPYDVRLAPAATRAYSKLDKAERERVRRALEDLAAKSSRSTRGGKSVKTIQGTKDHFHRLRVGAIRIMFDVIVEDRVILVLGIVDRADLERWLRNR